MAWINKRDVNAKVLLPKKYLTLISAFRSYHHQKEPEQNHTGQVQKFQYPQRGICLKIEQSIWDYFIWRGGDIEV